MTDDFDRQAAEVLVCHGDFPSCRPDLGVHCEDCPAYYRPAVAAALRQQAERIAELDSEILKIAALAQERIAELERALVMVCDWDEDKAFGGFDEGASRFVDARVAATRAAIGKNKP